MTCKILSSKKKYKNNWNLQVVHKPNTATGGVYQLRQGQQRRLQVRVRPVHNSGTLPIICQHIVSIEVGSVNVRYYKKTINTIQYAHTLPIHLMIHNLIFLDHLYKNH